MWRFSSFFAIIVTVLLIDFDFGELNHLGLWLKIVAFFAAYFLMAGAIWLLGRTVDLIKSDRLS